MSLGIRLLGPLEVLRDGRALPLPPSKKTRALLAYLVAMRQSHSRADLCELLWEGPDDPRAALRWSLTKIRRILDDDDATRLVTDHERASFEPRGANFDLAALRAETSATPLHASTPILVR